MAIVRVRQWGAAAALLGGSVLAAEACAPTSNVVAPPASTGTGAASSGGAGPGGGIGSSSSTGATTGPSSSSGAGGAADAHCEPSSPDLAACPCGNAGATRACYPASANAATRDVGLCKDGQQTCQGGSEFNTWGPCAGAVLPTAENCTDGLDHNCDGKVGCADPTCASNVACSGGCVNGMTRDCYDGPPGTEGTGICHGGTQTCVNGTWSTGCPGEQLPEMEVCSDFLDHNCNGLPGCFDFFNCLTDPACMPPPCMPANGCTCPVGTGDAAVCPDGDFGDPNTGLCCSCSASTCDQLGCCGEPECAGQPQCGPLTCGALDPSCNGMVNADCDFEDLASSDASNPPEDCDQVCCKCKPMDCP